MKLSRALRFLPMLFRSLAVMGAGVVGFSCGWASGEETLGMLITSKGMLITSTEPQ